VNKKPFEEYFPLDIFRLTAFKPLEVTGVIGRYDIFASVCVGGLSGQNGAMQLGIARALVEIDEELRGKLRAAGLLTRDPRMVERKKYGQKKARKRFQFSKR
jgi:small subunit ribosomal protein S9